jgi:hypothetical protein
VTIPTGSAPQSARYRRSEGTPFATAAINLHTSRRSSLAREGEKHERSRRRYPDARSLKQQGIDHLFGIVGFPVGPIAAAAQKEGINYIGMRNEQAASYAAQAYGYMTGRPGVCLVVTGPGVVHGLAGLANAQQNCWPMILIGGASETYRGGMGAFQEERQVLLATPFCKFAHGIESVARIPYYVEMATRQAIYGRPGASYLDMPDDIIKGTCDLDKIRQVQRVPEPPRMVAPGRKRRGGTGRARERPSGRSSSSARAWRGRAPKARCVPSSSAPRSRSCARRWARA